MTVFHSPIGQLGIRTYNNKLAHIDLLASSPTAESFPTELMLQIHQELACYFNNPQHIFTLKLHLEGTAFQQRVWAALCNIPAGTVVSYSTVAKQLNTSPRAVGNACRHNPIPIIIPCHRITAKNHLGGYAGETQGPLLNIKKWLLQHEKLS